MQITLNLLAPEKKTALRTGFVLSYAQAMVFIAFIVTAFIAGTLVSIGILLGSTRTDLAAQSSSSEEEYDNITGQITDINAYITRIDGIQQEFTDWSSVLESLAGAAPRGTRFDSIRISADGTVSITGTAPERDDVLAMQKAYEALPFIEDVSAPLSNILQRTNVKYEFTMHYVPPGSEKGAPDQTAQ